MLDVIIRTDLRTDAWTHRVYILCLYLNCYLSKLVTSVYNYVKLLLSFKKSFLTICQNLFICWDPYWWVSLRSPTYALNSVLRFVFTHAFYARPCAPLTRTRASVRLVHTAISSLVLMSGYRFLWKVASSSCSCWLVKCVRCRRCFFFLGSSAVPSSLRCSALLSFSATHAYDIYTLWISYFFLLLLHRGNVHSNN